MIYIVLLSVLGLSVSIYTYLTEIRLKEDPTYKPVCDISDRISCSKPIQSSYGKIFFVSNAIMGILFYAGMIILALVGANKLLLVGSVASCALSCVLAYLLYVKVQAFCLLCTSLYVINILMLIYCIRTILL